MVPYDVDDIFLNKIFDFTLIKFKRENVVVNQVQFFILKDKAMKGRLITAKCWLAV